MTERDQRHARVLGMAGIGFVTLAGTENITFQEMPGADARAGDIVRYYVDAPALLNWLGLLSLVALLVFSTSLSVVTKRRLGPGSPADIIAPAGTCAVALAAIALGIRGWLTMWADISASEAVASLHSVQLAVRAIGAVVMAVLIVSGGVAAGTAQLVPGWLSSAGWVVGCGMVAASAWSFGLAPDADIVVFVAFVCAGIWIATLSASVLLTPLRYRGWPTMVAAWMFAAVALAATVSGTALVLYPSGTARYFAWPLSPAPLTTFVGAAYVGAGIGYATALRHSLDHRNAETQGMLAGIVALAVPMAAATDIHIDVFDFSRWQSVAWVVIFALFPVAAVLTIVGSTGRPRDAAQRTQSRRTARVLFVLYGTTAVFAATWLWLGARQPLLDGTSPFGARVIGSWLAFVGVLALWNGVRPRPFSPAVCTVLCMVPLCWFLAALGTDTAGYRVPAAWFALPAGLMVLALTGIVAMNPGPSLAEMQSRAPRLAGIANTQRIDDPGVAACWELIREGIALGALGPENLGALVTQLKRGLGMGFNEFSVDIAQPNTQQAVVALLTDVRTCFAPKLISELERLELRYRAVTGHTSRPDR